MLLSCGGDDASSTDPQGPVCGDGVVADSEACDDGNAWGGDGCDPACGVEEGPFEAEPNGDAGEAQEVEVPTTLFGNLPTADRDCFAVSVPEAGAVRAMLALGEADTCDVDGFVELLDPEGVRVASGLPDLQTRCAAIDPDTDTFSRYLDAGTYTVCVGSVLDEPVVRYRLELSVSDSCGLSPLPPDPTQDLEADGIADVCDDDDDDDGVLDGADNCPRAPNGPDTPFGWDTSDEGFVRLWMVLGAYTQGVAPKGCQPSIDSFAGPVDADVADVLGDRVDGNSWFASFSWPQDSAILRFTDWFDEVAAPREAYTSTWVFSPDARDVQLAIGADDGVRAWVNGVEVGATSGCQGVYVDAFRFDASLVAGWNRLLVKVYDGGGGWGLVTRIYGGDGITPMTDLGVSLAGPVDWLDDQGDIDGDGIGDICDRTP